MFKCFTTDTSQRNRAVIPWAISGAFVFVNACIKQYTYSGNINQPPFSLSSNCIYTICWNSSQINTLIEHAVKLYKMLCIYTTLSDVESNF